MVAEPAGPVLALSHLRTGESKRTLQALLEVPINHPNVRQLFCKEKKECTVRMGTCQEGIISFKLKFSSVA